MKPVAARRRKDRMPSPKSSFEDAMARLIFAPLLVGAALAAGGAQAQTLNLTLPALATEGPKVVITAAGVPVKPIPDVEDALDPQTRPKLQTQALESAVFAKTAVDHRVGGATASAGLLCGRMPGHADSGMAGAYGVDPHGRFVGAKLSFAF